MSELSFSFAGQLPKHYCSFISLYMDSVVVHFGGSQSH